VAGLVHRSRLLGADRSIVNYGGGNTSTKTTGVDHLGRPVQVLWIKGSGSDLATAQARNFVPLRLEEVRAAAGREAMSDEEMVAYLACCALDPSAPRPSIETMLHAFLPFPRVDHTHPEAAIAFCACTRGSELAQECFGEEIAWVPYVRPGFRLAKLAMEALLERPNAVGLFLAKHGLVVWGESDEEVYGRTIDILARAESYLERLVDQDKPFGALAVAPCSPERRRDVLAGLLPVIRGELTKLLPPGRRLVLDWDASPETLEFLSAEYLPELAMTGAACPDHVMYTKFLPLVLDRSPDEPTVEWLAERIRESIAAYVERYRQFFADHCGDTAVEMLFSGPRVILIPGLALITAGVDAWAARNTTALYRTAIRVMRWARAAGGYSSLDPQEAWDIEYWPLELYKLSRRPAPRPLAGHVAVITGGAGAIGRATAKRLMQEDCHIVISDIHSAGSDAAVTECGEVLPHRVQGVETDVTDECSVEKLAVEAVLAFGGVDIVVANAGLASAAPVEELELSEWERIHAVLTRGYFLTARMAFRLFKAQGLGGCLIINSSKNGLAAGRNALAYASAKAAELHMTRCLAEEGGEDGIRVNAVAPDAVIRGSGLWDAEWREERARAYGFPVEQLEEWYRQRNLLKRSILAEDVAEAILFLASDRSAKTTGCVITVDGGLAVAFPR